ncbi:hypothetical protein GCM10018787_54390 [Streptomyces thermodiastaticus]|nr:hypothetical protein GCM10018787_54390 [Streptomyces thermodiastaticus]
MRMWTRTRCRAVQAARQRRPEMLAQKLNDPDITFDVRGDAEDYPIADNSTEEGRRKNRRVEVTFPRTER